MAKDVADVLGYVNPRKAVSDHCKSAVSGGVTIRDAIGREQEMTIIPERDVYRLVMRSKLPSAEKFEEWVVGDVLPSIRKAGNYTAPLSPEMQMAHGLIAAQKLIEQKDDTIALLAPKAEALDKIALADGTFAYNRMQRRLVLRYNF